MCIRDSYKIKKGKNERYAVTEQERAAILAEFGLGQLQLSSLGGEGKTFESDVLRELMDLVARIGAREARMPAEGVVPFGDYLAEATVPGCELPHYYVVRGGEGAFCDNEEQMQAKIESITAAKGSPPVCLLYTSPSPRDLSTSRMPSCA